MFDELSRALDGMEGVTRIPISINVDDVGHMDRCCPNEVCSYFFKVSADDWTKEVPDDVAFCPFCGHKDKPSAFNTPEQNKYIEAKAHEYMSREIDKALGRAAARLNRQQRARRSNSAFGSSVSLDYRPSIQPTPVPPPADEILRQDFSCQHCGCHWSSLGASYFCPACGHNSATSAFNSTMGTVENLLRSLPGLRQTLQKTIGADAGETTIRQVLEDQLPRLIGALERYSHALYSEFLQLDNTPLHGSVFQRLDDASALWRKKTGRGYDDLMNPGEFAELCRFVQQRHVIGHRQGIVDQRYIQNSGDTRYSVGQRLVITACDIQRLTSLVRQLGTALAVAASTRSPS